MSFYTTEEQLTDLFGKCGDLKRVIMGLDKVKRVIFQIFSGYSETFYRHRVVFALLSITTESRLRTACDGLTEPVLMTESFVLTGMLDL